MKVRPILFSAPMIRALLDGRKTQTRRIVKPQPTDYPASERTVAPQALRGDKPKHLAPYLDRYGKTDHWCWWDEYDRQGPDWIKCPYGQPGDLLYARETWRPIHSGDPIRGANYLADKPPGWRDQTVWRPSIHMPRWASRLALEVTDIRVERLTSISEADAEAEGVQHPSLVPVLGAFWSSRDAYARLWEHINGAASWDANPWVWVVSFSVHQQNVDAFVRQREDSRQ